MKLWKTPEKNLSGESWSWLVRKMAFKAASLSEENGGKTVATGQEPSRRSSTKISQERKSEIREEGAEKERTGPLEEPHDTL